MEGGEAGERVGWGAKEERRKKFLRNFAEGYEQPLRSTSKNWNSF